MTLKQLVCVTLHKVVHKTFKVAFFCLFVWAFFKDPFLRVYNLGYPCGMWMVCKIIFISNQTTVEVDNTLWLSWGCDDKNELIQTFQPLAFDV